MKLKDADKATVEKISIFMTDNTGYMYYCVATAGKNLTINSCAGAQGKPLSEGQVMSIELPDD